MEIFLHLVVEILFGCSCGVHFPKQSLLRFWLVGTARLQLSIDGNIAIAVIIGNRPHIEVLITAIDIGLYHNVCRPLGRENAACALNGGIDIAIERNVAALDHRIRRQQMTGIGIVVGMNYPHIDIFAAVPDIAPLNIVKVYQISGIAQHITIGKGYALSGLLIQGLHLPHIYPCSIISITTLNQAIHDDILGRDGYIPAGYNSSFFGRSSIFRLEDCQILLHGILHILCIGDAHNPGNLCPAGLSLLQLWEHNLPHRFFQERLIITY